MEIRANANFSTETGRLSGFRAGKVFATEAALAAFISHFPKFVKVKASRLSQPDATGKYVTSPYASFTVFFSENGVTGDKNEAGVKRVRKFLDLAGAVEWETIARNSYLTLEAFLAALDAA